MPDRWDDEEDWVGEPPEGRHTRDRAKPEFWLTQRPLSLVAAALGIALIVVLIVLLLS
jgi:hypothetical protein